LTIVLRGDGLAGQPRQHRRFVKAIQVYKEVGYPYLLIPDHVPQAADDPAGLQSFAYCYGYIRALIQAVAQMG
jgi:mannonate dehydratase